MSQCKLEQGLQTVKPIIWDLFRERGLCSLFLHQQPIWFGFKCGKNKGISQWITTALI